MSHDVRPTKEDLRRVNVVGVSGSGKSTFARRLSSLLSLPHIEMDALYWGPNWTEPSTDDFRQRVTDAIEPGVWVLDGNYHSKTHDLKWSRATAVVWLDMSLPRTLWRAVARALKRSWTGQELWPGTGNRESLVRSFLSHDSVVLWTLTSYRAIGIRYRQCQAAGEHNVAFFHLKTPGEVEQFLSDAEAAMRDDQPAAQV